MNPPQRVGENLNQALHRLFARDTRVCLLGEDISDPYGGAFRISKGLSTCFPDRVFSTPISEAAIIGMASGLALCGQRPIAEVMFGDFIALGFDQIYNFATKSVSMYGTTMPMPMLVRCPVGGNRGYGPTHSQNPQKHFIGIPHLNLFELSAWHDNDLLLDRIFSLGEPAILFEDKSLYALRADRDGRVCDLLSFDFLDGNPDLVRIFITSPDEYDCVIITTGGVAHRALEAARELFLEHELVCQVIVPAQLYPFDVDPLLKTLGRAERVCVVEEGVAGGTWGNEIALSIQDRLWGQLAAPPVRVSSALDIIPTASHLESEVLIQTSTISSAIRGAFGV